MKSGEMKLQDLEAAGTSSIGALLPAGASFSNEVPRMVTSLTASLLLTVAMALPA